VLLIVLVVQFGFWDTLAGILGAVGMIIVLVLLVGAILAAAGLIVLRRLRGGSARHG
jgi:hypothetical protein